MNVLFFFNDTATTEIYTLSLHDALPILSRTRNPTAADRGCAVAGAGLSLACFAWGGERCSACRFNGVRDRKSTRLNSSHANISYAVFCLKKKMLRTLFLPAPNLISVLIR